MQIPFLLFLLAFTAADIIFYKFLQLKSILTEKYFHYNVSFVNRFTKTPPKQPKKHNESMIKVFCHCSLIKLIALGGKIVGNTSLGTHMSKLQIKYILTTYFLHRLK